MDKEGVQWLQYEMPGKGAKKAIKYEFSTSVSLVVAWAVEIHGQKNRPEPRRGEHAAGPQRNSKFLGPKRASLSLGLTGGGRFFFD